MFPPVVTPETVISDEASLRSYLSSYDEKEKRNMLGKKIQHCVFFKKNLLYVFPRQPNTLKSIALLYSVMCSDTILFSTGV